MLKFRIQWIFESEVLRLRLRQTIPKKLFNLWDTLKGTEGPSESENVTPIGTLYDEICKIVNISRFAEILEGLQPLVDSLIHVEVAWYFCTEFVMKWKKGFDWMSDGHFSRITQTYELGYILCQSSRDECQK